MSMASELARHIPILKVLESSSPKLRRAILLNVEPEVIEKIAEICLNYLKGNIICDKEQYQELKQHKPCMLKVVKKGVESSSKRRSNRLAERRILLQKGDGFWGALLIPLVSQLSAYITSKALK
jgi:hypothetical protein